MESAGAKGQVQGPQCGGAAAIEEVALFSWSVDKEKWARGFQHLRVWKCLFVVCMVQPE